MSNDGLISKIANNILDKREGLDSVPSIVIVAIIKRVMGELEHILPHTNDGDYACTVDDIFMDWTRCEVCDALLQVQKLWSTERGHICAPCLLESQEEKILPTG